MLTYSLPKQSVKPTHPPRSWNPSGFSMASSTTAKMLLPFSTTSSHNSVIPPGFLHLHSLRSSLRHPNREEAILDEHHRSWRAAQYNPGRPQDHRQASGDVRMITVVKALLPKCYEAHMPISATLERSTNQCPRRLECGTRDTVRVIRTLHGQCHSILRFIVGRQLALLPPGCSPNLPTDESELGGRNPLPS
jgi:hypothetical protein